MAVPTSISELSTTPGSNPPSGSDSPTVTDDHFRAAYSFIKTLDDGTVKTTGDQTIAGVKTFSSTIVGSVSGSASDLSATLASTKGGTGSTLGVRGYIAGLTMSTAGSSATMSVAAGQAADANGSLMDLASSIAKTTSAWAVGSTNGGKLSAAAIANNTWYYFYLIRRPDTGVVDVGFDVSATTPTLPTNYTQYRYIGAALTNGSAQWVKFFQSGDKFLWDAPVLDVSAASAGTSAVTRTLTSPRKIVTALLTVNASVGGAVPSETVLISPLYMTDSAPSNTASPGSSLSVFNSQTLTTQIEVETNASAQVRSRQTDGSANSTMRIITRGWVDSRGRDA